MNRKQEEWMKANQDYLIAEINVVKAELIHYQARITNEERMEEKVSSVEHAEELLRKIETALDFTPRLKNIVDLFQLSSFEKKLLLLSVGIELDAGLGKLISQLHGDNGSQMPTFSLSLSLFSDAHWSALTPESALRYWQLITVNKAAVLTRSSFAVDELILHYLTGIDQMDSRLHPYINGIPTISEALVPSHQKVAGRITQHLSQSSPSGIPPLIQLEGNSSKDQKGIVAHVFAQYNMAAYHLPIELLPTNFKELADLILLWNRAAILHQSVLFLEANQLDHSAQSLVNQVKYLIENTKGIIVISTHHQFSNINRNVHKIYVEKPSREEQQNLWKTQLGTTDETLDFGNLVTQFNLDSHSILNLAQTALASPHSNGTTTKQVKTLKDRLWDACCNYTRPNLSELAQRIEPLATWDDLVLPKRQKNILKEIGIHVQQRQKVYDDWGFRGKSNRGLGISALFAGESGTGKTMAAEVIANELQLDLFKIDLSQVVNKYIGETEKNLKKIFDAAEDSGAILLFDEADALFGKRSDVKDSHDRHSNIEVSYLLQKMESYRGLAILTTNMKKALDTAFLRRIRFVVQFPFPDVQHRGEIWKRIFPKQTPTHDLNMQKLANLNVAGGNIRNIALNASFAAAHKNEPVTMRDIHNAARNEYVKLEKHMSPAESLI